MRDTRVGTREHLLKFRTIQKIVLSGASQEEAGSKRRDEFSVRYGIFTLCSPVPYRVESNKPRKRTYC